MHAWYPNNLLLCIRIKFPDSLTVICVSRENSFIVLLSLYSHKHNIHGRQRIMYDSCWVSHARHRLLDHRC